MIDDKQELIARITKEVLSRLGIEMPAKVGETLAVCPGSVFDELAVSAYLQSKGNVTSVLFGEAAISSAFASVKAETPQERKDLVTRLKSFEAVVVVTPPLSCIEALAAGDDGSFEAILALRPLLWGKDVTLLLDFALPRHKRALKRLSDSLDTLEQMGMKIEVLTDRANEGRKDLVTEQDVKAAAKQNIQSIKIMPGAIVTQLAIETAGELGISIEL